MKKLTLILTMLLGIVVIGFAQEIDTVAVETGFRGFYQKYGAVIWSVLGIAGVTAFLQYRFTKIKDAFDQIVAAAQDGMVTEVEFQAIVKTLKAIWGKKNA